MMKIDDVLSLIRPNIQSLTPYSSARSEFTQQGEFIFLDANENAFGAPVNAIPQLHRYPSTLHLDVKQVISQLKKVPIEQIFLGNGSDESIDILIRMFCKPAVDEIIILPPTYGMYEVMAQIHEVNVVSVPLNDEFQPQVDSILDCATENTRMIFICSPNNPTGNLIDKTAILHLLKNFHGIVVVDEAYIDYAQTMSFSELVVEYPNLVVLQTFSKAWGMAGLRTGLTFAHPEIIQIMNKVKMPYNVSTPSIELLKKGLCNMEKFRRSIEITLSERKKLVERLSKLSIVEHIYPSHANFILVKVIDADRIYQHLIEHGIVVRNRSKLEKLTNCLRITVGTPDENERLTLALKAFNKSSKA